MIIEILLNWRLALQDILAGGRRQKVEPRALVELLPLQFWLLHCSVLYPPVPLQANAPALYMPITLSSWCYSADEKCGH